MSDQRKPGNVRPTGKPGEFAIMYGDGSEHLFLIEELRFMRPDQPLIDGWVKHPIQLATYRDRVAFARRSSIDGNGTFDPVEFRRIYPSSRHTLLVKRPIGR